MDAKRDESIHDGKGGMEKRRNKWYMYYKQDKSKSQGEQRRSIHSVVKRASHRWQALVQSVHKSAMGTEEADNAEIEWGGE